MNTNTSNEKYEYSKLNVLFTKLSVWVKELFTSPICINACLHYDKGRVVHRNWGDDINVFFLEKLWKRSMTPLWMSSRFNKPGKANYLVIGSTIAMLSTRDTVIYGGGIIDGDAELPDKPKKVLAVRGPLTREYLLRHGVDCPEVYGDPAMLIPYYYSPTIPKRYKLGIIPHYDDYDSPLLDQLKNNPDILFIKMEGYNSWTQVIDQIVSCENIASSSLHGLIMAEAYGIPNLWIEVTGQLLGGHFKFHDFFCSLGIDREQPFKITPTTTYEGIMDALKSYKKGFIDLKPLIEASPFPIKCKTIK